MAPQITPNLQSIQQEIEPLLAANDRAALRMLLNQQHPADIADVVELLNDEQRVIVFSLLQPADASEVLDEVSTEALRELVEAIPAEQIADLLEVMPMDDAAEVLSELHDDQAEYLLSRMEPAEAAEVESLLAYPDETAGRLMTTRVIKLKADWTIDTALTFLRQIDQDVETLAYLYVVNDDNVLVGILPLRAILMSPVTARIADLMERDPITVQADTDQEEVARIVAQYDYFAIPVVDQAGRFLGIITHDDVVDIFEEEFTEDIHRLGGSQPLQHTYLSTPILTMVRKRIGWLLLLFLTGTLTGTVMRLFQDELQSAVALSLFIPLLIGTGGNSGSQTTNIIIRALAIGEVSFNDIIRLAGREMFTGLLLGTIIGVVGFGRAVTWHTSVEIGLTVSISLLALVIWANTMGAMLPLLASRLGIDPPMISGPVMSTLVDATGLFIYFTLARFIIGL
jgi:magnesium transporter